MSSQSPRRLGVGRLLIAVYGILAVAATGRSFYQIATDFSAAPLAYSLSAVAAVVYVVATVALVMRGRRAQALAVGAIVFELVGVLTVGTLSLVAPELFAHASVWSWYGLGYGFIPLALPVLGLWWLSRQRSARLGRVAA